MEEADSWFDQIYKQYAHDMIKVATVLLSDRDVAEEIVQDVFVILLMRREVVEHHEKPHAWLYCTLRNRIKNELQRARYKYELPFEEKHENFAATNDDPFRLEDILPQELDEEERNFLVWYYEEDRSHEEIAKRLNISVHASHMRLHRLRLKCFRLMAKNI